jgi:DNA-binding GntR family transcriptional regulator
LRWHFVPDRDAVTVLREHEKFLDAIAGGNKDNASRLATEHVRQIRAVLVPGFARRPDGAAESTGTEGVWHD